MSAIPCHGCGTTRPPGKYLCHNCWASLPHSARRALSRRDSKALARLRELHRQLDAGVALTEIQVNP